MRQIILKNSLCPGDVLMLTAAVRDLHLSCPGEFETDLRSPFPELWENNPYLVDIADDELDVERIECHYPLIQLSNHVPYHFIHGFRLFLSERLGVRIRPHAFHGDIHLDKQEKSWLSQVDEITGTPDTRFWIIVAGGKTDYTAKWWDPERYQAVVDHFAGRLTFVQCGEASAGHVHEPLKGVIDLIGKTDLRQLVRLTHHADGVVCPVTLMMHLAAAVETRPGRPRNRPCVVIAGGREPAQWEAYPHHQYLHVNGCLPCCDDGGCWKSRVEALGDHEPHDNKLCLLPVRLPSGRALPKCLDMVTARQVIEAVDRYLAFDDCYSGQLGKSRTTTREDSRFEPPLNKVTARARIDHAAVDRPKYPGGFTGRGVVIPGGGNYFGCAWVCINRLRDVGCKLPIELWHLGAGEMTERMKNLVEPMGVTCVDALEMRTRHPARILRGWELKPYALLHSRFREVLLLDADNVPVVDPTFLFMTPEYRELGAIFWPDYTRLEPSREIWGLTGVEYRDEAEFESGQIVVNKQSCWRPLSLAMWMNEHSDFWYRFIHGDKDTFHFAWRKLGKDYSMPRRGIEPLCIPGRQDGAMCQHDFTGRRIFQHRNFGKWTISGERGENPGFLDDTDDVRIPGFMQEDECRAHIEKLRNFWVGNRIVGPEEKDLSERLCQGKWIYQRVGRDKREMSFGPNGRIRLGAAGCERNWEVQRAAGKLCIAIHGKDGLTCHMFPDGPTHWRGRWLIHEQMEVELIAIDGAAPQGGSTKLTHHRSPFDDALGFARCEIPGLGDPSAFNGSTVSIGGGRLLAFRQQRGACSIAFTWLGEDFRPVDGAIIESRLIRSEDPRLSLTGRGRVLLTTNYLDDRPNSHNRIELRELEVNAARRTVSEKALLGKFAEIADWPDYTTRIEKNWAPFEADGELYYVYSMRPHRILKVNEPTGSVALVHETQWQIPVWWRAAWGSDFHLSAPPVRIAGGRFLSTWHTRTNLGHWTGFYEFESVAPFRILRLCEHPVFTPEMATPTDGGTSGCIFICGMELDEQYDRLLLTGGDNDHSVTAYWLSLRQVRSKMNPLAPGGADAFA